MHTTAQYNMTRQERTAFGPALLCAVADMAVRVPVMVAAVVNVIKTKRHLSKPVASVSRFIGLGWNSDCSIRGANPRVANG